MTLILKQIFALVKLLNSDTGTNQIAWGVAMGFILGFSPMFSLQALLVFVLLFFFRIQMGAAFLTAFFFKFVAYMFDPILDTVGTAVLSQEGLKPLFTELYNMPIIPLTRFNNSVVMGSGLVGFLLAPVVFVVAKILISQYRVQFVARFQTTKFWKVVQATSFYKWYVKYDEIFG